MLQLCWNSSDRKAEVLELPNIGVEPGFVRVRNAFSVISAGTEKSNTELSLAHPLKLMRSRPDLVDKVKRMARSQGLRRTWEAVQNRVGGLQPVGYSCAGVVEAVGDPSCPFAVGDAVACAGANYAVHAEQVLVPYNLCALVPAGCEMEAAALGTLGAIALQGFRLSRAVVGERVLVIGLGLIGQLSARIALAAGCTVAGLDPDQFRGGLLAAQGPVTIWTPLSAPQEADFDAVLVTAAAPNADPVVVAGRLARSRGRVVAVGLFPLELPREVYYHKELEFVVSRSTGPGRYDPNYEELGHDYPAEYVRWTEQRNIGAYLDLVAKRLVRVDDLITHRFAIQEGARAYTQMLAPAPNQLGLLLSYPNASTLTPVSVPPKLLHHEAHDLPRIGMIGAGKFARAVLLPALAKVAAERAAICTRRPLEAHAAASKFGFARVVADSDEIVRDANLQAILIASRHDSHADLTCRSLQAGKAVFVEKPLAISAEELARVESCLSVPQARLMVGFNRRFAPLSLAVRRHFEGNEDRLVIHYRVNAGFIPAEDWIQSPTLGGGRIVGEACHFVDWISFVTNSLPASVYAASNRRSACQDEVALTLTMENGAVGVITYVASGSTSMSKERIEVFGAGKSAIVEDWQWAELASGSRKKKIRKPGKGHVEEIQSWVAALRAGSAMPIAPESLLRTTAATLAVRQSLTELRAINLLPVAENLSHALVAER
ncbi:MAG TPA: bi-domain-containing oxidoreductase [Terriglobales bacterium]|nr:bi-domain-containing oxidoreductase [Terriglobales bacterium]